MRRMSAGRVLVCALGAAVAAIALSGCDGDKSATESSTTTSASTSTGTAPTTAVATTATPSQGVGASANAPWYPSLQAFEHYDSARSHVFSQATFNGSLTGPNDVKLHPS